MVVDNINQKKRRNQLIKTKCAGFMLGYNLKCVSTSGSWKKNSVLVSHLPAKQFFDFRTMTNERSMFHPFFESHVILMLAFFSLKSRKTYHWTEKIQAFHLGNIQWLYVHFAYTAKFMAVNKLFKLWQKKIQSNQ